MNNKPIIGITTDNKENTSQSPHYEVSALYAEKIGQAGGVPIYLSQEISQIDAYLKLCHGFLFTGGLDPKTEIFGQPTHPKARPIAQTRQDFEMALLARLHYNAPEKPVLGICLGCQMMALSQCAVLNQYLPDTLENPEQHQHGNQHTIQIIQQDSVLVGAVSMEDLQSDPVASYHQQAIHKKGNLRIVAKSQDKIIEAVDDPSHHFFLGVQWHPERGGQGPLNQGLFNRFVAASQISN